MQLLTCSRPRGRRGFQIEQHSQESPKKQKAISELRYEEITEVFLQSKRRFWSEKGIDGTAMTDLPIGMVIDHTATQPGIRGILQSQTEFRMAQKIKTMKPEDRLQWTLAYMDQVHPGFAENFDGGFSFSWSEEPWELLQECSIRQDLRNTVPSFQQVLTGCDCDQLRALESFTGINYESSLSSEFSKRIEHAFAPYLRSETITSFQPDAL